MAPEVFGVIVKLIFIHLVRSGVQPLQGGGFAECDFAHTGAIARGVE